MENRPLSAEEFKYIYSKVTRLAVDPVVRTKDGILLSLRTLPSWHTMWHLPGGTVLYKETVEQAIRRLMKWELGIEVRIGKLLGYMEFPSEEKERGFGWTISLAILCDLESGTPKTNEDASEVRAFKELPLNIVEEHGKFLTEHWQEIRGNVF